MKTEDDINDAIDAAIQALSDNDIRQGADQLYELAVVFAKAGQPQSSFENVRGYIIQEAERRTDARFIKEKLTLIEREMYERRNRTEKSRTITKQNTNIH